MPATPMPATPVSATAITIAARGHCRLICCTVLLAILPAALWVPTPPPGPDASTPQMTGALMTEVNSDGVRVIVD